MCEQQHVDIKFILNLRLSPKRATFAYSKSFTKLENGSCEKELEVLTGMEGKLNH